MPCSRCWSSSAAATATRSIPSAAGASSAASCCSALELAPRSVICQIAGRFAQMPHDAFRRLRRANAAFASAVQHALLLQWYRAQQTIACNFAHSPAERCARWTLMTHDAVGAARVPVPRGVLAMMLGVQTHVVTEPMAALQAIGAIRYAGDMVTIVSERRLREAACECYCRAGGPRAAPARGTRARRSAGSSALPRKMRIRRWWRAGGPSSARWRRVFWQSW